MHKKTIPDSSARNSAQIEIPAGLAWIKNYYSYINFKKGEVGQFLHQLKFMTNSRIDNLSENIDQFREDFAEFKARENIIEDILKRVGRLGGKVVT
ncbi:hypothetical protein IPdc08_00707 [archaeon]|nr:hypothetical protein IPdc08_00707 [archaeon]